MTARYSSLFMLTFFGSLLLCGCATKTETTRYYLLSDPGLLTNSSVSSISQDGQCVARVGAISIAPYLQRTNIVLQSGTNELVPALQHRWSEPLNAGVQRLLDSCLSGNANAPYRADVTVDHLHGNTEGSVVLQAHWSITRSANTQAESAVAPVAAFGAGNFSARLAQPVAGYDSLVSTQRELVLGLCADIRAAIPDCD